jgi:hypothetical protein
MFLLLLRREIRKTAASPIAAMKPTAEAMIIATKLEMLENFVHIRNNRGTPISVPVLSSLGLFKLSAVVDMFSTPGEVVVAAIVVAIVLTRSAVVGIGVTGSAVVACVVTGTAVVEADAVVANAVVGAGSQGIQTEPVVPL